VAAVLARARVLAAVGLLACEAGPAAGRRQSAVLDGAEDEEHASVVLLRSAGTLCSAVSIESRFLLTARHCLDEDPPEAMEIWSGTHPLDGAGALEAAQGEILAFHLPEPALIDLALVETAHPLGVPVLPFARDETVPADDSPATAVGHGITDDEATDYGVRRAAPTVVTDNNGVEVWTAPVICHGDSGGALLDEAGVLVGIAQGGSFAESCRAGDSRWGNVGRWSEWIDGMLSPPPPDAGADAEVGPDAGVEGDAGWATDAGVGGGSRDRRSRGGCGAMPGPPVPLGSVAALVMAALACVTRARSWRGPGDASMIHHYIGARRR
jgi:hypothetical protein